MELLKENKITKLPSVILLVFALVLMSNVYSYSADLAVDSYCQLSIQTLQQEVSNSQTLVALATQYPDDRDALNQQEAIKKAEFNQARETLFNSYGITDKEYAMYMGKNGRAVKKYLEANPVIKQQIDDLSAQKISLLQQYEQIKGPVGITAPPLP